MNSSEKSNPSTVPLVTRYLFPQTAFSVTSGIDRTSALVSFGYKVSCWDVDGPLRSLTAN